MKQPGTDSESGKKKEITFSEEVVGG
jgi:hypothetical protein